MERILLVEDDDAVRSLTERILTRAGYSVCATRDGQEACVVFAKNPGEFDLVLMDMIMPKMGGREAYEEIMKVRPGVAVILCSGLAGNQLDYDFLLRNRINLLVKPYLPDELLTCVRTQLQLTRRAAA